ncbi:MAG: hypothetical protein WDW36_006196 [Sanguina aurantia]
MADPTDLTLDISNLEQLDLLAKDKLPRMVYDYYRSGSHSESTLRENRAAFASYRILPRMLQDMSHVDLSSTLLGMPLSFPVMVAPMAMHGMAHPDGELATARAAAAAGVPFTLSTMATRSIAEVAATGHPSLIFQLYVIRDRGLVTRWVREAEALGYTAIMVTVDAQRLGHREADERNSFHLPPGLELKNLTALETRTASPLLQQTIQTATPSVTSDRREHDAAPQASRSSTWDSAPQAAAAEAAAAGSSSSSSPETAGSDSRGAIGAMGAAAFGSGPFSAKREPATPQGRAGPAPIPCKREGSHKSGLMQLFRAQVDDSLSWDFIPWLKSVTSLPIILKGLLHPEDALLALHHKVDAIVVSNHGGRQLDCAPSALEMLPFIVEAVRGRIPVIMDGGIRRGTDIIKALALGARCVLLGRPLLYALSLGGQAGVRSALQLLRSELELSMALAGCRSLASITPALLRPANAAAERALLALTAADPVASGGAAAAMSGEGAAGSTGLPVGAGRATPA